ncbi:response regulator [Azospirillum canadense]|uniref:response regulator n=1 Tax=Azospirillum canadense TaxID=403962 RepID=UPI002226F7A8|nr:response regulator [Azospirillum canadense]MCW2237329.1 CheY-like chemotaxis protein [Azospirillum canadense]
MPDYDFSLVDAAIIDTQHNTLRVLREVLSRLGLKRAETYNSARDAARALAEATPDLILLDADGEEAEALRLVRNLRNEPDTRNPYACIVATTWQPTPLLLTRVTNAGADDLLVKPVSPKQVQDRLATLIENRKKFVVTADYTGPDRRKSPRDGAQVPLLDAPNTLRLKATNRWAHLNARQLMAEANGFVNEQKLMRASVQVSFLIEFAVPGLSARPPERMAVEHLARVPGFLDDLLRRLDDSHEPAPVETTAKSLKLLAERLRAQAESGAVAAEELERARSLARELMQGVDRGRPLEAMTAEVATAVAGYRARLEQIAQAKAEAARVAVAGPAGQGAGEAPKEAAAE